MGGVLAVFAKQPVPGQVKTRLCPPFTPPQAAAFYACLLADVLEASGRMAQALGLAGQLCVYPPSARQEMAAGAPTGFGTMVQQGPDLGARMEAAFEELAAAGYAPILIRGSDSPTLSQDTLAAALAALQHADLVLCPDRDGGYNLVGLRAPAPGLLDHPMSTGSVLADTLARAEARGLRATLLEPGFDLDTAPDLALLQTARRAGQAGSCPRSLAWLDENELWPDHST